MPLRGAANLAVAGCRIGACAVSPIPNDVTVPLTKAEYALLVAFLDAPRRPLSREHLMQATRMHEDVFDRSIDVQVLRLRRKLEADPSMPRLIKTERGVGYLLDTAVRTT